ncbi:MAG: ABC-F family ATP-binding cassette domain-containing protein [Chitinophagales bacterium]|nr:ABC-F family ATP-binding cassette domain-containing protein [Chitinophagales bacterium]
MNYLTVENLRHSYADRVLLDGVTFYIDKGQKVALVAKNGSGKSTLLRIIAGLEKPEKGTVSINKNIRFSYLSQEPELDENKTITESIFASDTPMMQAIRFYEEAMEDSENQQRMKEAFARMDAANAWDYESKVSQVLGILKIHHLTQAVKYLSGGQKKRIALAKVLLEEPDFLVMDEPTNHLDLDMIEWFEQYLDRANMTLLMVTHDRYFLDSVCNEIIELDKGEVYRFKGDYAYYIEKKAERQESELATIDKAQNLLRKELDWMRRQPKARGTKARARIDAFYDLKEVASKDVKEKELKLSIKMERLGGKILELHHVRKAYGDLKILEDFSYKFREGERVGIVGPNGSGKSTLLNMIMEREQPDGGKIVRGDTIVFGYYSQAGIQLPENKRVIEVIKDIAEYIPLDKGKTLRAESFLERFLFPPEQQYTPVSKLSGGEKRRLYLMTILMKNPNFLILDEPTNDLDIVTLNVLEEFLEGYKGCLLMVSHDRHFMDKLTDHLFVYEGEGIIKDFNGNYTEYKLGKEAQKIQQRQETKERKEEPKPIEEKSEKKKLSYKEQREYDSLEAEIAQLETQRDELTAQLGNGNLSGQQVQDIGKQLAETIQAIDEKTNRWIELAERA